MKKILMLLTVSLILTFNISSQNNIGINSFKTGDCYVFIRLNHSDFPYRHDSSYVRCIVTYDTIANNKTYYRILNYPLNVGITYYLYRYDDLTGRFLRFDNTNICQNYYYEALIDSLWAGLGDDVKFCSSIVNRCIDNSQINIFGYLKNHRVLHNYYGGGGHTAYTDKEYVDKFGLYRYTQGGSGSFGSSYTIFTLKGCVINDTLYGDTTNYLLGIQQINSEMPAFYNLSQNYPNPFNPTTNIKFDIPKRSNVKVSIYDILGKEVSELLDEELNPGTFEVNWDASNFPSGVYFYKIVTDGFNESKRMVLVK